MASLLAGVLLLAGCGPGGASESSEKVAEIAPGDTIAAEVCVEGDGRAAVVYFKNLGDSEWQEVAFSLEKGGELYTLGAEAQSMRPGRSKPTSWPPESAQAAEAFTDSGEFTRRTGATWAGQAGTSKVKRATSYQESMERLGSFSHLTAAMITVGGLTPGEWSGDVVPCG